MALPIKIDLHPSHRPQRYDLTITAGMGQVTEEVSLGELREIAESFINRLGSLAGAQSEIAVLPWLYPVAREERS